MKPGVRFEGGRFLSFSSKSSITFDEAKRPENLLFILESPCCPVSRCYEDMEKIKNWSARNRIARSKSDGSRDFWNFRAKRAMKRAMRAIWVRGFFFQQLV